MDGSQIREITVEGIEYVDDEGELRFIDFAICHENYVEKYGRTDYVKKYKETLGKNVSDEEFEKVMERARSLRGVGARQILGPPWADGPYIEFFTEPPTRFEVTEEEYNQILGKMYLLGLLTFDRS